MEYVPGYQYLPGDQRLVEQIVYELKSHGIFDQFRKDCLADVDTKPAYQNLRQRVESAVSLFLDSQKWKPEMNKNLLREKLRKNMQESGFLETGVERIVDQVVNPKISTVFLPQVEEMVYKYLGIEKPKNANGKLNGTEKLEVCTDLLPTDLEAISPDSVTSSKNVQNISIDEEFSPKLCENEDVMKDAANDEHESPPFEPLADKSDFLNENSNDSHLSGISGLTSRGSLSPKPKDEDLENINQDSILSRVSSSSQASIPAPIVNASNSTEDSSTKYNEQSADETMKTDGNETDKQDLSENNIDLKMDIDSSMSCDSDAKALVIITESSNDAAEEKPAVQENIASNEEIKTEHNTNTNTNETQSVDKDSANSDLSKSSLSKSDKTSSKSDKHSNSRKRSSNSHSSHSDKHHSSSSSHRSKHKHHDKEKERSVERKDKTDHDKDKDKSKKYKKSRDSRDEKDDKEREKSRKNEHSKDRKDKHESSHSKHGSSSDKHHNGKSKSPRESSKSKSSSSHSKSSKKHSDEHSSSKHAAEDHKTDKDKARKKSKSQDDHSSAKNQKSDYRRSTDRDSNDGNGAGSKKHSFSSQSVPSSNKQKENTSDTFPSSNSSNEMSDSTQVKAKELSLSTTEKSENSKQEFNNTTGITEIRKPKIASNIYEARKLIKVRRKIERRNQKQKAKQLKSQMSQESSDINTTPQQASSGCDEEECVKEIEEPTKEENVPKKKRLSDTKENSSSDGSQFYGFTDDLKVFYDVDTSSNSDEMEIAHNLSATSSNEFDESQEQTKQKSKEEIMEIIFGRGVVPSTNSKDGETVQNGGFQVSYCSDYDDDQDNMEVSTVDSPKNNEVTNCVNNNVHKRQKLDDSSKINMSKSNGRKSNKRSNTNNVVDSKSSSSNKSDANTEDTNEDLSNKTLSKSRISRSSAYQTQCYTNEDLYKPRPSFGSSRRRKVSAL